LNLVWRNVNNWNGMWRIETVIAKSWRLPAHHRLPITALSPTTTAYLPLPSSAYHRFQPESTTPQTENKRLVKNCKKQGDDLKALKQM
jgi:hypothetical protein